MEEVVPILILVAVIALIVNRLPKVDVGHSKAFVHRRLLNWVPLGLTYAFLYMARYNLVVVKTAGGISGKEFGDIDAIGSLVYGVSFLLNGPLTDKLGGRTTILIAAGGAIAANVAIGVMFLGGGPVSVPTLSLLYALNMYFQSFGAVSIVKVNASWFHLRERGTFGGIFGILISLGLYFAFDWNTQILAVSSYPWVFFVPAAILGVFWVLSFLLVRDKPSDAGLGDFDPQDASSNETASEQAADRVGPLAVLKRMLSNPIIMLIAVIELCSGFLRQGIFKWFPSFAVGVGLKATYFFKHWGMVQCIAGMTGGMFAGLISDRLFGSRRAPVAAVLYMIMLAGALLIAALLGTPIAVCWVVATMAMAIIGVHGMLSGVASQDFGGRKHAGIATGLIDGFVYLGSALQSVIYGNLLPGNGSPEAAVPRAWTMWPIAMLPMAAIGLALSVSMWNARVVTRPKS